MKKASIGFAGLILVSLAVLAVVMIIHTIPFLSKAVQLKAHADISVSINDGTGKIGPLLKAKTEPFSNLEIISCIIEGLGCSDSGIEELAASMDTGIRLYDETMKEVKKYGNTETGELVYVDIPLPGGRTGKAAFAIPRISTDFSSFSQRSKLFGDCRAEGDDQYIRNHLVSINFMGRDVYVNKLAADDFEEVVKDIKKCTDEETKKYDFWNESAGAGDAGTYSCRPNTNNPEVMSMHSYGLAIDINPGNNPNCPKDPKCNGRNTCITDIPECVIDAFRNHHFRWGCDFNSVKDAMHFEWMIPSESSMNAAMQDIRNLNEGVTD